MPTLYDHTGRYDDVGVGVIDQARKMLSGQHLRVTHCADQLAFEQLWWRPAPDMNAVGNLMLHLAGNVGQWIVSGVAGLDFERDRPAEFAARRSNGTDPSAALRRTMEQADRALRDLPPARLLEPIIVQGFDTTRLGALLHATGHFEGHAQEIVCLTRQQLRDAYRPLWQPTTPAQTSAAPRSDR